ncbi:MAG: AsmA family protein [Thermodesulfobacteriota bacterium]
MKRALKWLVGLLLVGVMILVGLWLVLPKVIDPSDIKDKITEKVYEKSGYQIEIPGDIKLQVTPSLDVLFSLGQIRVQSGPDFPDTPLFSSEEARIELSLMPLLREKRLAIQRLALHGVYCNLIRDKAGKENWKSSPAGAVGKTATEGAEAAGDKSIKAPELELGGLDVSRITVRFEDQQAGKRFELKDFSLHTGPVREGQPFHLQSQFSLVSSAKSNNAFTVVTNLDSDVTLNLAAKSVDLKGLQQTSTIQGFGFQETKMALAADAFLDLGGKNAKVSAFTLSSGDLSLKGKVEVNNFSDPGFQGTLAIPDFSLRNFLKQNRLPQPAWKDDAALGQVGFSCGFGGDSKKISVSDILVSLDGAKGSGSFTLTEPSKPAYDFRMHFDRVDLDRYAIQPPHGGATGGQDKETAEKTKAKGGTEQVAVQPLFPVETLKKLRFQLQLDADSMKVRSARLSQVQLAAKGSDGLLELKPFAAKLYDGALSAEAVLDVRGKVPQLTVKKNLDHVQIGPLLRDMTGKEDVTGAALLSLQLATRGNSRDEVIRAANGNMKVAFEDGVIRKLHILQVIRQAKALLEKEIPAQTAEDEPTGFARISGSGVIKNGVLYNKDLQADSDLLKVTGSGKIDFVTEYVDYLLNVTLLRGVDRNQETGKTDYSNIVVPYRIRGEFSNLKEEADAAALIKSAAQSLLMNELQKQLTRKDKKDTKEDGSQKEGEKKNSTQQLLEQGLKSLFGN